jgi:hypothetical protein
MGREGQRAADAASLFSERSYRLDFGGGVVMGDDSDSSAAGTPGVHRTFTTD